DVRIGKRELARQLAEEDLTNAILANREADAQRAQQPEPQPEDAQGIVNEQVHAARWAESDRRFSAEVGKAEASLNVAYAQAVGQRGREFGDTFAARDKHSAVAALPPQRAARLQQLLAHERALESQWNGVQQGKLNYARERSGAASQMRE